MIELFREGADPFGGINGEELVRNADLGLRTRLQQYEKFLDPRRDLDIEAGVPKTWQLDERYYKELYDRSSVGARAVEVLPVESWGAPPSVYETSDNEEETDFERAWKEVGDALKGKSWYKPKEDTSHPVWSYLRRADILSGIGSFGVVLLGLSDGRPYSEPVASIEEQNSVGMTFTFEENARWVENEKTPEQKQKGERDEHGWYWKTKQLKGKWEGENRDNNGEFVANSLGEYRLTTNAEKAEGMRLLSLRVFDESLVDVVSYEDNPTSPRYGFPLMYRISLSDPNERHSGVGQNLATINVHWTRVLHVADNLTNSEVFGVPRLRPIYDNVYGLKKLTSGSPEMYWRGAFPGLSIETHPQLGGDVEIDTEAMRGELDNYWQRISRALITAGVSVKSLAPQVVDPTPHINIQIDLICIKLGIPKRIFIGSERGELASSQDEGTWNDRMMDRQREYITPSIICPFVDRLILAGVLPEPSEGYTVEWPDLGSLDEETRAKIAETRTRSFAQFVSGDLGNLIHPLDYFVDVQGFSKEQVTEWLKRLETEEGGEGDEESKLRGLVGGITGMVDVYKAYAEGAMPRETVKTVLAYFFKLTPEEAEAFVADLEEQDGIEPVAAPPTPGLSPPGNLPPGGKIGTEEGGEETEEDDTEEV